MTQENKRAMMKAIGMIEGVSFVVSQEVANALVCAVEMLESVYEEENEDNKLNLLEKHLNM